jgi:hypothetical protein
LITSECSYDEKQIRKAYHGLIRIEDSFRILKSDLSARPVFLWNNERIKAHFLTCFVSLLLIRIIQHKLGDECISARRISRTLSAANCRIKQGGIIQLDDVGRYIESSKNSPHLRPTQKDELASDYEKLQNIFGTDFYYSDIKQEKFNQFLRNLSVSLQK